MLKAGFYEREITPPLGHDIPGYFCHRFADGVESRLYAKAIALNKDDKTVIIISIDAITTSTIMRDNIIKRVTEYTGVPAENIMISATHTHYGACTHSDSYNWHHTPDEPFFDVNERLIADTATLAWQRMVEVSDVKYASSQQHGLGFNRNFYMKDGTIRTNPGWQNPDIDRNVGVTDDEFITLYFFNTDGKPYGSIMNFSCHHDTAGIRQFCADYSGLLADNMREEFGSNFVTVFLNGACGNINHVNNFREKKEFDIPNRVRISNQLTKAALEHFKTAESINFDTLLCIKNYIPVERLEYPAEVVQEYADLKKEMPEVVMKFSISAPDTKEYKRARADSILNISKMPKVLDVCIQSVRLGDVCIFALPGEVFCEFGLSIKEQSPAKVNMIATCANGTPGCYIPMPVVRGTLCYEGQISSAYMEYDAGFKFADEAIRQSKELNK